jgi:putative resolvase
LVDAKTAETLLCVNRKTLIKWARAGQIGFSRPNDKGKWLFDVGSVGVALEPVVIPKRQCTHHDDKTEGGGGIKAIYARVSTRKQLDDLQSQVAVLTAKYPDHIVITDCGSGLNFKRKGLLSLLQLAFEGRLQHVRIAHRDRLCRFAYDLIEHILNKHGAEIHVEAHDLPPSAERELAEDVLSVITVFGARLHGARSAGRRGKRKADAEEDIEKEEDKRRCSPHADAGVLSESAPDARPEESN